LSKNQEYLNALEENAKDITLIENSTKTKLDRLKGNKLRYENWKKLKKLVASSDKYTDSDARVPGTSS
jgi:hypothetical protein